METPTRTAAMAQATPVRNGKETKVLLTTKERGTNLIGIDLLFSFLFLFKCLFVCFRRNVIGIYYFHTARLALSPNNHVIVQI